MTSSEFESASKAGYTELVAWQKSYQVVLEVHRLTLAFPAEERYCLVQQARRSALSVPCNLAEGWGRGTTADYLRFAQIARGSANELQTQMWVARDLGYIQPDHPVHARVEEVQRIMAGLIRSLMERTGR